MNVGSRIGQIKSTGRWQPDQLLMKWLSTVWPLHAGSPSDDGPAAAVNDRLIERGTGVYKLAPDINWTNGKYT